MRKAVTGAVVVLATVCAVEAITLTNGGSFLNDFELVGRWQCRPGGGYINVNDMTVVPEGGTNVLYAFAKGGANWALRKYQFPQKGAGVMNVVELANRPDNSTALAYSPNYQGGALWSQGTYFTAGWGMTRGSDANFITADAGDMPLIDNVQSPQWYYYNSGGTFLPAKHSLTGRDAFVVVRNGGGTPHQDLMIMEPDTSQSPNLWKTPQLTERGVAEDDRTLMLNLSSNLGVVYAISAEFCDYSAFKAQPTLYVLAVNAADTYHLLAITPGTDGVFGETSPGECDDLVAGYTFGEPSAGNSYTAQKRHITWEAAPADTTLVGLQGGYSSGFQAAAYDPTTKYIYLHGSGDYANGIIIRDKSWRTKPPPTGTITLVK